MDEYNRFVKKLDEENFIINVEHIDISSRSSRSSDPKSTIRFTFSLKNVLTRWDSETGIWCATTTTRTKTQHADYILISLDEFRNDREKARQIIDQKLKGWRMIPLNWRQQWIEMALDKARALVTFMPTTTHTHDHVSINFNVTMASTSLSDKKKLALLNDMFTEIENFAKANPDPCTICLTQFYGPSEFVSTPCRHNFHGDCLNNWLRINPSCPICSANIPRRTSS